MTFYVTNQNTVVLVLTLLGAVSGIIRDIVKVKRRFVRTGKILEFFEDFICCIVLTFIYHMTVFVTNYGYVRWYEVAGLILGFGLYRITVSDIFVKVLSAFAELLHKLIKLVAYPVVRIFKMVSSVFMRIYAKIATALLKKYTVRKSGIMEKRYIDMARVGFIK